MLRAGSAILASSRLGHSGRGLRAAGWCAATLGVLFVAACFSLDPSQRLVQLEAVVQEPELLVVVDPRAVLAFVTAGRALTFSTGIAAGDRLRAEFALPSPTPGFAEAFVAALRRHPRFATTRFRVLDLDDAVATLPERLWKGSCTFRGPGKAQPIEAWRANGGAQLHEVLAEALRRCGRKAAELFVEFLEGGKAQGTFDFGDLRSPAP